MAKWQKWWQNDCDEIISDERYDEKEKKNLNELQFRFGHSCSAGG